MIIGVDAGALCENRKTERSGVFYYSLNILKALGGIDKKNTYLLYGFRKPLSDVTSSFSSNFRFDILRPQKFWHSLRLPLELFRYRPDYFLGLTQSLPFSTPNSLVVIHDIAYEFYPRMYPNFRKIRKNTLYAIKKSSRIVAVSETTKNDLINFYKVPHKKIAVIPHGVSEVYHPIDDMTVGRVRTKFGIAGKYFMFVGKARAVKNTDRIVEAFLRFNEKNGNSLCLCLAGDSSGVKIENSKIIKTGVVSTEELAALYTGSTGLLAVSLYEGSGMTVLEALACGCPLLLSDKGALKEIPEALKFTADPMNTESIEEGIRRLTLSDRKAFRIKAVTYASGYSWEKSASNLIGCIMA